MRYNLATIVAIASIHLCEPFLSGLHRIYNKLPQTNQIDSTTFLYDMPNRADTIFDEINEEDWELVQKLALGEDHVKELSSKVETAMNDEWDIQAGVNPGRFKAGPLKANIDLWSYNAKNELRKGNFSGAMKWYQHCIEYNPMDGRAWLGMARIHWKKHENELAEKCYKDGLYYDPKNPYLLQGYAIYLEKTGKMTLAMDVLTKSVKFSPQHAASWVSLARLHQRQSHFEEAQYCYSSAVEHSPSSYVAYQAWGVLESELGNTDKARELFQQAIKISKECAHAYQAWATLEKRQGRLDEATSILNTSLTYIPDNTRTRVVYAEILELQGKNKETREIFKQGEKYAKKSGDAGFFQSWASFEIRCIQQQILQAQRKQYYKNIQAISNEQDIYNYENTGHEDTLKSSPDPIYTALSSVKYNNNNNNNNNNTSSIHSTTTAGSTGSTVTSSPALDPIIISNAYAQIRRLFKMAVTVNQYHSASWTAWAKFEQRLGNTEIARKLLVAGISKFPHSRNIGWFHCAFGNIAYHEGDYNTARACYSRALAATPIHKSLPILMEYARMEGDTVAISKQFKIKYLKVKKNHQMNQYVTTTTTTAAAADTTEGTVDSTNSINTTSDTATATPTTTTSSSTAESTTGYYDAYETNDFKRERELVVSTSIKEARRLYELAVKRFPHSKLAWNAYFDFETRQSTSTMYNDGKKDRLKELSQRRHDALSKPLPTSKYSNVNLNDNNISGEDDDDGRNNNRASQDKDFYDQFDIDYAGDFQYS